MCGIAGFWTGERAGYDANAALRSMAAAIRYRGPDDEGYWWEPELGVGFAHRRLSIIDLSAEGHQPMTSVNGRYVISYNGEVYNFSDLRGKHVERGVAFRGGSDTEVMLAEIECHGLANAARSFTGMFAFSIFDRVTKTLALVRDRLGEKPLYYARMGQTLLFASQLSALRTHPEWRGDVDRNALALFLRHSYVPAPYSIYQGVRKVAPGTILTFQHPGADPVETTYWSAKDVVERGLASPVQGDERQLVDELDALLRTTVRREMISDVPLGAFLSGGIDSSLIVALMQAQSARPVRTFTIGFHEREFSEADHAKAVARHLGTEHTEFYVTPEELLAVVPRLPMLQDEPFADSSQVPTLLVAELARRHVTVSLSGDGGDELFGGYSRYFVGARMRRWLRLAPETLRHTATKVIRRWSPEQWDRGLRTLTGGGRRTLPWAVSGDRLHKLADVLESGSDTAMYLNLLSHWREPSNVVQGAHEPPTILTERSRWATVDGLLPWMMYMDLVSYLPDDILVKVDRASMSASLEARAPYLDHNIVEFAWRLPLAMKVRGGTGKWVMRQVLYRYVPKALLSRPKMGFGVPLGAWLRGPLRPWAQTLLDPVRLKKEGYFHADSVARKWAEHQAGTRNWQYHLWDVLMFQAWHENQ